MISYITLGVNDIQKSLAFYDEFMKNFGVSRMFDNGRLYFYGDGKGPMLAVGGPYDEQTATHGNGTMVALGVASDADVDRIYKNALELGATCDGEPGVRAETFYFAYVRDFDNNKIAIARL